MGKINESLEAVTHTHTHTMSTFIRQIENTI